MNSRGRSALLTGPRVVGGIVVLVLLVGLGVWISALSAPVLRVGSPTSAVTATRQNPTPTPNGTDASASPEPSSDASDEPEASADMKSTGKFTSSDLEVPSISGAGYVYRYRVEVETSTKFKANQTGVLVADILNDPRSWAGGGAERFGLVRKDHRTNLVLRLAAPATLKESCGKGAIVCARKGQVWISAVAWRDGSSAWESDLDGYRRYLINHAVGLLLGEKQKKCIEGQASVMADQFADLGDCTANPWPFP